MAAKIQSEFLFVGRGDEGFLENYSYELEDDAEHKAGTLFMSLEISNNDAEAEDIGEAIFANLKQKFYEDLNKNPYGRFEEAVKAVNNTLEDFRTGKVTRFIGNLNILIGALVNSELFITSAGDAEAYLIRKRFVSVISEGLAGGGQTSESEAFFENIGSGELENEDVILLASSRLLRYITKSDLAKLFKGELTSDLSYLQEALATEILGRAAVIGISVQKEEVFEEETAAAFEQIGTETRALAIPAFLQKFSTHKYVKRVLEWSFSKTGSIGRLMRDRLIKRDRAKDRMLIALAVVIIILLVGIVWLNQKGATNKEVVEQENVLIRVQELINDAAIKGQFDRDIGAALLKQAEGEVLKVLGSRYLRSKASRMMDEIQNQRVLLDNVKVIENPQVLADLADKKKDASAIGLAFLKDRLYAFSFSSLFSIILDKLQDPISISGNESIVRGAAFPDKEALAFMTRSGKIIEFKDGRFQFMDTADRIWKKGVDLRAYSDKIYILDPDRNQIWRYRRKRDAYDIAEGINVDGDLRNAVSFTIDAAIYVANSDGSIAVLYGGNQQKIPFKGAPFTPIKNPKRIYTEADLNQLFVLEPSQNRVVAFAKDRRQGGQVPTQLIYTTQYVFKNTGELRDLYVSKDEGKIYLTDGRKIYVAGLTQ